MTTMREVLPRIQRTTASIDRDVSRYQTESLTNRVDLNISEETLIGWIRRHGELSISELVKLTDFSRTKISSCINSLLDKNILVADGSTEYTGGRRSKKFAMNGNFGLLAGVAIGVSSVDLGIADFSCRLLARHSETLLVKDGPIRVLGRICSLLENMLEESNLNSDQLIGMGVGVPGPVDFSAGTLVSPPGMPGWDRYPITQTIQQWFPNTQIVIDNDVNAMALAEVVQGTGKGVDSIIFVKIGTGIGAGLICEGRIYRGANGCAGDIAHISVDKNGPLCYCGNKGCLEVLAAGQAFFEQPLRTEQTSTLKDGGALQAENLEINIGEGYAAGAEDIRESGQYIGDVLACLVNFYNPGMIVIGGGGIDLGSLLLSSIRERVFRRSLPLATRDLQIIFSEVGPDAGLIGTTNLALDNILNISACQALPIGA